MRKSALGAMSRTGLKTGKEEAIASTTSSNVFLSSPLAGEGWVRGGFPIAVIISSIHFQLALMSWFGPNT
jgi:hypothetical protein